MRYFELIGDLAVLIGQLSVIDPGLSHALDDVKLTRALAAVLPNPRDVPQKMH